MTIDLAQILPWLQKAGPVGYGVLAAIGLYRAYAYLKGRVSPPAPGPGVPPLTGGPVPTPPPFPLLNLIRSGLASLGHAVPAVVEDLPVSTLQQMAAEAGQLLDQHRARHAQALAALGAAPKPA